MRSYRRAGRLASLVAVCAMVLSHLAFVAAPAEACWCRGADLVTRLGEVEHAFKFRVTELIPLDERNAVAFGEVVEAFKGDVERRVRVGLNVRTACLDVRQLGEGTVIGAIGSKGRYKGNGVCDEATTDWAVEQAFLPVQQPERGAGSPAFLVANDRLGARLGVVDDEAQLAFLGPGSGYIDQMAVCPGGLRSVEIVVSSEKGGPLTAEVRDLATLDVQDVRHLVRRRADLASIEDLTCHDEEGQAFSYLAVNWREPGMRERRSVIEVWRGAELTEVPTDDAVHAVVDLERGFAYALVRQPQPRIERWDLVNTRFDRAFELAELRLVDMALDSSSGRVTAIAGRNGVKPAKKHGKGVLVHILGDEVETAEIRKALRPKLVEIVDGRIYTAVTIRGEGETYQVRGRQGKVRSEVRVGRTSRPSLAVSGDLMLVRSGTREFRLHGNGGDGLRLVQSRSGVIAALPAAAASTVSAGDLPPLVPAGGSIVAGGPLPPSQRPVPGAGPSRLPWLLAGLGTVVLLFGGVAISRRLRPVPEDAWMAEGRQEEPPTLS